MVGVMTLTFTRRLLGLDAPQTRYRDAGSALPIESVVALIAGLSFVAGLVHVGASLAHFTTLPFYATAFAVVATLQIGWAGWVALSASTSALVSGVVANVAIVALWVTSLTVAVQITPLLPAHPHTVYLCVLSVIQGSSGGVSALVALTAILPELVIAVAVACLLAHGRSSLARRAVPMLAPVLLAAMFLSVLYGVGGHGS
jgi:hypothetical protein